MEVRTWMRGRGGDLWGVVVRIAKDFGFWRGFWGRRGEVRGEEGGLMS